MSLVKKSDALRFVIVGIVNTALDFLILNTLITLGGLPLIIANIISTTLVMIFSFTVNNAFVFVGENKHQKHKQILLFVTGTLFGLYVIQTFVIIAITQWWPGLLEPILGILSSEHYNTLAASNIAKIAATSASMIWNYLFYKFVVFKKNSK